MESQVEPVLEDECGVSSEVRVGVQLNFAHNVVTRIKKNYLFRVLQKLSKYILAKRIERKKCFA